MHKTLRQMFGARAAAVVAASKALAKVSHNGLRGQLRELLIAEFFRPLLPPQLGVGHGEIVDSAGGTSTQQDIVIYDRELTPPALVGNFGVFPIDAVLYSFEIKSRLTLGELRKTERNAKQLLGLGLMRGRYAGTRFVIPGLIAFSSNTGKKKNSDLERYLEMAKEEDPTFGIYGIRMLCVAEKGYWFFDEHRPNGMSWVEGELSEKGLPGYELLDLLSAILNGCEFQRRGRVADLNSYLVDTGISVEGHQGLAPHGRILSPTVPINPLDGPSGPLGAKMS